MSLSAWPTHSITTRRVGHMIGSTSADEVMAKTMQPSVEKAFARGRRREAFGKRCEHITDEDVADLVGMESFATRTVKNVRVDTSETAQYDQQV